MLFSNQIIFVFTFYDRVTHKDIDISALPTVSDDVVTVALSGESRSESSYTVEKKCDRFTGDDKMKDVI